MKKKLDLILNGKGGVGKSFFANNFLQFLKDRSIEHVAIDTDNENSTLKRFHPEVAFIDIGHPFAIDRMFAELKDHSLVIVDCRAASTDFFLTYFKEVGVFDLLKDLHASLTVISPVNHELDSIKQIQLLTDQLGKRATYVVVKNHSFSSEFKLYETSKTRTQINEFGGKEIDMPKLHDWLVVGLNQNTCTLTTGIRHPKFSVIDRQRLKNWQKTFNAQIESAAQWILPPVDKNSTKKGDPKEKVQSKEKGKRNG